MGIVKRQSIKTSIVLYFGMLVGYLNMGILFPYFLTNEQIGLLSILTAAGTMLSIIANFGMSNSLVRFWPFMRSEEQKGKFLSFAIAVPLVVSVVTWGFLFLFRDRIVNEIYHGDPLVEEYFLAVIPYALSLTMMAVFMGYSRTYLRITIPNLIQRFGVRLMNALAISLMFYSWINYPQFVWTYVGISVFAMLVMGAYSLSAGGTRIGFGKPFDQETSGRVVMKYAGFSLLMFLGDSIISHIDVMMLGSLMDLEYAGIYKIGFFLGMAVDVPFKSISQISAPIYAMAWRNEEHDKILDAYKSSALNLLLAGVLIFTGIWINLDNFFEIMPRGEEFRIAKWAIFWIATGKLFSLTMGTNSQLLNNSKYYLVNFYALLILSGLTIGTNFIFIPKYGITGAALATTMSLVIYNLIKFLFIWIRLKMQPFEWRTLIIIGIGAVILITGLSIPKLSNPFLDVVIRSGSVIILYGGLVLLTGVSKEANQLFRRITGRK